VEASAEVQFDGLRNISLTSIEGTSGGSGFRGDVAMQRFGQMPSFEGSITADTIDLVGLASALFGAPALLPGAGLVPEGPLATDTVANWSRGRIALTADVMTADGEEAFGPTSLALVWDAQGAGIDRLNAELGGGTLGLNVTRCCAGALPERTIAG